MNKFWGKRTTLETVTEHLVNTALGREKADLVIEGGNLVNVHSAEVLENVDVAVKSGRIALVGKADHTLGRETMVIDAKDKYVAPGFLDGHVHVESSMVTVTQFARAVLPHGTTSVFIDPHEIANVFGLRGVKLMLDEGENLPLKVLVCVPSCVPAAPNFETAGAEITPQDVEEALKWEGVVGLGEVMNYQGVLQGDAKMHAEIQAALRANKVVEGHADALLNTELAAYAAAGISSCHESTRKIDGIQRLRLGMYAMIREGSAWRDVADVIKCVTEQGLDPRHVVLVTDDRHPETLITRGHMDGVIRRAIAEGVDAVTAIQMATLNTAEHFGVSRDIGSIAPSKRADIAILNNLSKVRVETVIADGVVVAREGKMTIRLASPRYPRFVKNSVHMKRRVSPKDFIIKAPIHDGEIRVHVIGIIEGKTITKHLQENVPVKKGKIQTSVENGIAKVVVVERHRKTGNVGLGLVKGFGFKEGAVASTVAHDSHNMLVVGMNDRDMAFAVNKLGRLGGGMIAVRGNKLIAVVKLPIAGLMSDKPIEKVSKQVRKLHKAWVELGCTLASPFMTMSLLTLPVLPELRITDKGLVDTQKFEFINLLGQ